MVVIDVPVQTGQDTVSRCLHVVTLPGTSGQTIGLLHVVRETLQLLELRTTVGRSVRCRTVTGEGVRTNSHVILILTVHEEEQLILDDRTAEGQTISIIVTVIHGEYGVGDTVTLQRSTGDVGIKATLELVGTTLGDSVDTTTGESALTNVVRGDRDGHLIQSVE